MNKPLSIRRNAWVGQGAFFGALLSSLPPLLLGHLNDVHWPDLTWPLIVGAAGLVVWLGAGLAARRYPLPS